MEERERVEAKGRDLRVTDYKAVIRFLLVDLFRLHLQKYIFRDGSTTMGTLVILTFMVRLKKIKPKCFENSFYSSVFECFGLKILAF